MIRKAIVYTITIVSLLCPQVKANQQSVSNVKESIVKHSLELGIDPALALSIAKSESGFRHEARSHHGAVGVFQLMPSTAKKLGVNPYYLSDNIKGGLMYYKRLYNMFGSTELALAAYNAGPKAVKRYNTVPPIGETRKFVNGIMDEYSRQKSNPDPAISKGKTITKNSIPSKQIESKNNVVVVKYEIATKASPKTTKTMVKHTAQPQAIAKHSTQPKTLASRQVSSTKRIVKIPPVPIELPAQGVI